SATQLAGNPTAILRYFAKIPPKLHPIAIYNRLNQSISTIMKNLIYIIPFFLLLTSCVNNEKEEKRIDFTPVVENDGQLISFSNSEQLSFFATKKIGTSDLIATFSAPATIAAVVVSPDKGQNKNIVLFED